jgi:hypothetical protein
VANADDKTLAIFFLEKSQHPASIETQPNDLINNIAGSIPTASTNISNIINWLQIYIAHGWA